MNTIRLIMTATLSALLLAGCGAQPTAPVAPGDGSSHARWQPRQAPSVRAVHARATTAAVHFSIAFSGPQASLPPFAPDREGGWAFQLFLDTDGGPGGYGGGLDYLVRGIEVSTDGRVHVRRTLGGGGPGGWGESVGRVTLSLKRDAVQFAVPLSMLGGDDGAMDFRLETYATVAKRTEQGVILVHEFVEGWRGTSSTLDGPVALTRSGKSVAGPGASFE